MSNSSGSLEQSQTSLEFPSDQIIVRRVRRESGISPAAGPTDDALVASVRAVAETFEFWYSRVMREAVDQYRKLIVARINPYIRRMQLEGAGATSVAKALVADYDSRNFVTAGGWVLEALAVNIGVRAKKSLIEGVDLERTDGDNLHLCVLKSGTVTRNSDILKMLKTHVRRAQTLHHQDKTRKGGVVGDYVQMTGNTSQTHIEDGIRRPSSAQFWSELTELPAEQSLELTLAVVAEASRIAKPNAERHVQALELLVSEYIRHPVKKTVDWEFIARRNMSEARGEWENEDKQRDKRARAKLQTTGYEILKKPSKR